MCSFYSVRYSKVVPSLLLFLAWTWIHFLKRWMSWKGRWFLTCPIQYRRSRTFIIFNFYHLWNFKFSSLPSTSSLLSSFSWTFPPFLGFSWMYTICLQGLMHPCILQQSRLRLSWAPLLLGNSRAFYFPCISYFALYPIDRTCSCKRGGVNNTYFCLW